MENKSHSPPARTCNATGRYILDPILHDDGPVKKDTLPFWVTVYDDYGPQKPIVRLTIDSEPIGFIDLTQNQLTKLIAELNQTSETHITGNGGGKFLNTQSDNSGAGATSKHSGDVPMYGSLNEVDEKTLLTIGLGNKKWLGPEVSFSSSQSQSVLQILEDLSTLSDPVSETEYVSQKHIS